MPLFSATLKLPSRPPRLFSALRAAIPAVLLVTTLSSATPLLVSAAPPASNPLSVPHRWERFPVSVYFVPGSDNTLANRNATRSGFDRWATATNGALSYIVTNDAQNADIVVQFLPGYYVPPNKHTMGRTELSWQIRRGAKTGGIIRRAYIRLAVGAPEDGPRAADLAEVAAHEWGHALGLNGHSSDKDDLMYAVTTRIITVRGGVRTVSPPTALHFPSPASLRLLRNAYPAAFSSEGRTSSAGANTGLTSINIR